MGILDWFKEDKQKSPEVTEAKSGESIKEDKKDLELERKRSAYNDPTANKETIDLLEKKREKEEEELEKRRKKLEEISEDEHTNLDQKTG